MMNSDDLLGIDFKKGMAVVGNNKAVFVRLLKTFVSNTLCDELVSALEAGDVDLAKAKAHALKGVSGNMRFDRLFEIVKSVESDMMSGKILAPNDELIADLVAVHAKTLETANRFIENPDLLAG
jgi:HPt (histidine-containing phosphotransfer) domain-containing protein